MGIGLILKHIAVAQSTCLIFFGLLGHAVVFPPAWTTFQSELKQAANWAAITCIVVTAPLIGKVSEVSVYRIIGTVIGGERREHMRLLLRLGGTHVRSVTSDPSSLTGFWGFLVFTIGILAISPYGSGIFVSLASPVLILSTSYLAFKKGLEQLARFMQVRACGWDLAESLDGLRNMLEIVCEGVSLLAGLPCVRS